MSDHDFEQAFYSGYTIIPNDLIRMRKEGAITRAEFEVLHLIFAFKNFHKHKTSSRQMTKLIGDIKPQTVSTVLKSLEEKGMIRSEQIDYHNTRYHLLLRTVVRVKKSDESDFYFDSSINNATPIEMQEKENDTPDVSLETQGCVPRDTMVVSLGTHIELNKEINKNKKEYIRNQEKKSTADKPPALAPSFVFDLFNQKCSQANESIIPSVKKLTSKREKAIIKLSNGLFLSKEEWKDYLDKVFNSDFLKGKNKSLWHATFDWILNESNCIKILEGNYSKKEMPECQEYLDYKKKCEEEEKMMN